MTARTDNMNCDSVFSIIVTATWYDVDKHEETKAFIYPNPVRSKVTIQAEDIIGIRLVDVYGIVVMDKNFGQINVVELSIGHLTLGVYLVEIITTQGKTVRRLVVKDDF